MKNIIGSGIYKILNLKTGIFYIGSALILRQRKYEHFKYLKKKSHYNIYLQNAFNKHGEENFIFEILEFVPDKTKLIEREQHYLDTLLFAFEKNNKFNKLGYNIFRVAGSSLGRKCKQESIIKGQLTKQRNGGFQHTEEHKEYMRELFSGRIVSEETKQKMRKPKSEQGRLNIKAANGHRGKPGTMLGKKHAPETIQKAQKPVVQLTLEGVFLNEFISIKDAGEKLDLWRSDIGAACKGRLKKTGGFKWMYKSDYDKLIQSKQAA